MRNYKRKTNKGSYDKNDLREAVLAVRNGILSGYKASQLYKIPRMTIMDHVNRKRKSNIIGRRTALSLEIEKNLASCIHTMEKHGFGITRQEVLEMVGEYVNNNNISTSFKNGVPGKDWFVSFAKRHNLSIKKPQALEYARKTALDPFIVIPYFDLLEKKIDELNLKDKPHAIWNMDETSFCKDPLKTKIVGAKGHAAIRVIATPGKDNTTVLLCASAAGQKAPPLIIFKGKNVWDTWTSPEAYPGTTYAATKNGWMESNVFEAFFKKTFLKLIGDARPVLLIYDGHATHVGLNIVEEARKANVTIIKLPAHSSNLLQPLDVSVMKSFKDQWDLKLVQWQRLNVGTPLPKNEFSKLIGVVWAQLNPQVLRNGFRKTGIYPINRNEIDQRVFDCLKLKRWQESISTPPTQTERGPHTLLYITLMCLNKKINIVQKNDVMTIENRSGNVDSTSFEELLLRKIKGSDNSPKTKRRKVALGAEVITHDDVIQFKKDEQDKKRKKEMTKEKSTFSKTHDDDVVLFTNLSKKDSMLIPFAARNSEELPLCLQNCESPSKVQILSDIVIKSATKPKDNDLLAVSGPSGINMRSTRNAKNSYAKSFKITAKKLPKPTTHKGKGIGKKTNIKENQDPNPKPPKMIKKKRSSSTTSVSGSYSRHSDSDIADVSSDYEDDIEDSESKKILQKTQKDVKTENSRLNFNLRIKNELKSTGAVYSINDQVLVRYYNRNNWIYYVGIIENINIIDKALYYSVRFYKTIKKPQLMFKMARIIDRDDVPAISIVKKSNYPMQSNF